jgi:hypothetical protein
MPTDKKVVGLATLIAITTAINVFVAAPAFLQYLPQRNSPSSTLTNTDDQIGFSSQEVTRPILIGGVAAVGLTALGLATALLSGKNKEQLEAQLKGVKEIAHAAKTPRVQSSSCGSD